jgi:hypothetical protein
MPTEKVGRVSSASVHKNTGKDWDAWIAILDKAGARSWTHQEIVAHLKKKNRLSLWWQQGVALGYETAVGLRAEGANFKGEYGATITRTFPIGAKAAWKLMFSPKGLSTWLKPLSDFTLAKGEVFETESGAYGEVRTMKAGARARLKWNDPDLEKASILQVYVVPRPTNKCIIAFTHEGLPDPRSQERLRAYWKSSLDDLLALAKQGAKTQDRPRKRR